MTNQPIATDSFFMTYSVGICYASVCTNLTVEEATKRLNIEHPTGVGPWALADEPFSDGSPNPTMCNDGPGRQHFLFSC